MVIENPEIRFEKFFVIGIDNFDPSPVRSVLHFVVDAATRQSNGDCRRVNVVQREGNE